MKRLTVIALLSIVALITSNVYFYFNTYQWQVSSHKKMLNNSMNFCSRQINQEAYEKSAAVLAVFNTSDAQQSTIKDWADHLNPLFDGVLQEISFTDTAGCITTFYRDTFFVAHQKLKPCPVNQYWLLNDSTGFMVFTSRLVNGNETAGVVSLSLDPDPFLQRYIEWCDFDAKPTVYIYNREGKIFNPGSDSVLPLKSLETDRALWSKSGITSIPLEEGGSSKLKVLMSVHPLFDSNQVFMAVAYPLNGLKQEAIQNAFLYGFITLIIITLIIVFFTNHFRNQSLEQERLEQSELALTKVLHYLPTGIILMDKNHRVRQVNRAAVRLFQLEDEDIVIGQLLNENLLFSRFRIKDKYQVSTQGMRYIVMDASNKERIFFNDKIPFFLQSEKFFLETYHELTAYVQPKGKSPGGFESGLITNITHELRTPLNGILGMIDMLMNSPALPGHEKEITGMARRSAETLMGIINDILDYSRLESGNFEVESIPFNLMEEVNALVKEFVPLAREKKIVITTAFEQPLPIDFIGDPLRFRQVLSNVLNNAIKFTPFGTIQITTAKAKTVNGGPAIRFSVKDSGIGIKPEKLKSIFEPFAQADQSLSRNHGGTGLGTTISKQLVLLMGGEIFAKCPSGLSTDAEYPGAEICFTLPLKTRKIRKNLDFTGIYSFAQLKGLVVTDDPLQVQVISRNFIALGLDFKVMPPTPETIKALKEKSFHLVVIDHRFDLNGLEFLQEMHNHQLHKELLIIVQSSDFRASNTTVAHKLGADVYLRKPIPLTIIRDYLLSNFTDLMARERGASLSVPEELKILVVEDNELNKRVIGNLFRKIGYDLALVTSLDGAFEKLSRSAADLILIDYYLMQCDVDTVVKQLKVKSQHCPVVVMASASDLNDDTRNRLLLSGVDDFLLKPFDMQLIADVLFRMVTT